MVVASTGAHALPQTNMAPEKGSFEYFGPPRRLPFQVPCEFGGAYMEGFVAAICLRTAGGQEVFSPSSLCLGTWAACLNAPLT